MVINRIAQEVINQRRGAHPEFVFTYRNKPATHILNSAWLRAREKAELRQVRVHDLKHTFGRRLRAAGVTFEDRQDLLGHKSGRITTHYSAAETARFSNPGIADQAEALKGAIELDQVSVEALLVALHSDRVACSELLTEDARPLCDWIARDPHTDRWRELLAGLR